MRPLTIMTLLVYAGPYEIIKMNMKSYILYIFKESATYCLSVPLFVHFSFSLTKFSVKDFSASVWDRIFKFWYTFWEQPNVFVKTKPFFFLSNNFPILSAQHLWVLQSSNFVYTLRTTKCVIFWTDGRILTKLAQIHCWEIRTSWLDFGDLYLIFKVTATFFNEWNFVSVRYLMNQWTHLDQTCTDTMMGGFEELNRFWWPWLNFQGHSDLL